MKLLATLAIILGLAAGGWFGWHYWQSKQASALESKRLETATVEARDILFAVTAAGDIGPADQVSVRPEINGRIAELPVDIGDRVSKDALLCRLDDRDLQIERDSRVTEIDGAKLQLEKAARSFTRNKQLFSEQLISQEVFDDSRTEFHLATNGLERAEKALRLIEDRLSKTAIRAPFDCTVLTRPVSLGQTVSGAAGFNSGTEVMTIANLKEMIINAHINQADVTRLRAGQDVEIQVESVPGLTMKGVVERIAPQAVIKNGIKGFAARVQLKDIDPRVRPGMTAILTIPVASAENVLAVPLPAVFTEQGERFVFVKKATEYERRSVVIGITDFWHAEIQEGLVEGEVVALEMPPLPREPQKPAPAGALGMRPPNGKAPAPAKGKTTTPATSSPRTSS